MIIMSENSDTRLMAASTCPTLTMAGSLPHGAANQGDLI